MSRDGQGTKQRRNITENVNPLSWAHERYKQTTDRRTDDDIIANAKNDKMLSYHRETARYSFGCVIVLAKGGRLELVDNILRTL